MTHSIRLRGVLFCGIALLTTLVQAQDQTVVYRESYADFPNPERGFYLPTSTSSAHFVPLNASTLATYQRQPQRAAKATYSFFCSLVYRGYRLETFKTAPLDEAFLKNLQQDFATARSAGVKLILRFAYTDETTTGTCPDEYKICPPYGDAAKPIVLTHIQQLKPILHQNADVIALLQMGFIGIWGENYFTDYFGDASTNGLGVVPDSSWQDRNAVLSALLDALPADRMVQVRTPQMKQRFVYGPQAPVTAPAMTDAAGFTGSPTARVGFHNDCFLASADDYGTFYDYGNSTTKRGPANDVLRRYLEQDSRYTAVGGETCDDAFSPQNDCAPVGQAEQVMMAMHYSYLNASYNTEVNNDWQTGGCLDNIRRKLGYRFVLREARLPHRLRAGKPLQLNIHLANVGYASPYNARPLELILRHTKTRKQYRLAMKADVRRWLPGRVHLQDSLLIPANVPPGQYELLLNLPDAYASLANRPAYSIRLANEGLWETGTGFNRLQHRLTIY